MKGISLNDLPPKYKAQAERQLAGADRISRKTSNMESPVRNKSLGKEKGTGYDRPVVIRVCEKRHRLPDSDGASFKYLLDAIVTAKILADDNEKIVKDIKKETIKISKDQPEETIVEIWSTE